MKVLRGSGAVVLAILLTAQPSLLAQAQDTSAMWRTFAEKIEVGARLTLRLRAGARFTATLVEARPDVLLVQPRTRLAVPVRPVPYDDIVSIEREKGGGVSAGKAAAIGVASGVGTFFAVLFILVASIGD